MIVFSCFFMWLLFNRTANKVEYKDPVPSAYYNKYTLFDLAISFSGSASPLPRCHRAAETPEKILSTSKLSFGVRPRKKYFLFAVTTSTFFLKTGVDLSLRSRATPYFCIFKLSSGADAAALVNRAAPIERFVCEYFVVEYRAYLIEYSQAV